MFEQPGRKLKLLAKILFFLNCILNAKEIKNNEKNL